MPYKIHVKRKADGYLWTDNVLYRDQSPREGHIMPWKIGDKTMQVRIRSVTWTGQNMPEDNQPIDNVLADEIGPA
jgi:lipoprotein-anchoring transpeptidase ErfK/SrfK